MRLDKFLQVTGLIKRRTLANEACKRGLVRVNNQPAKPTKAVVEGDELSIDLPSRAVHVKVLREITGNSLPKIKRPEYFTIVADERRTPPANPTWDDSDDPDPEEKA